MNALVSMADLATQGHERLRIDALLRYQLLDSTPEESFDSITNLAATFFDVPIALVSLVDESRQWFKSRHGVEISETDRSVSFCSVAIERPADVLWVGDTFSDSRFVENPLVIGPPYVRFYAGAPLVTPEGFAVGTLCILGPVPRPHDEVQEEQLKAFAKQVMTAMTLRREKIEYAELTGQLLDVKELNALVFSEMREGLLVAAPDTGRFVDVSEAACKILGGSKSQIVGLRKEDVLDFADPRLKQLLQQRSSMGVGSGQVRMRRLDGSCFESELRSSLHVNPGQALQSIFVFRNIDDRTRLKQLLKNQADLLDKLSQRVPGAIYQFRQYPDGSSCFPYASEGIRSIYEVSPEEAQRSAKAVFERLHPDDFDAVSRSIQHSMDTLDPWELEYRVVLPKRGLRWCHGQSVPERLADGSTLWHGYIHDITDRKSHEELEHRLANIDSLTGLPNRALMRDRLEMLLASSRRSGQHAAVVFVDLDRFKHINDAKGHSTGDQILVQVAERIRGRLRSDETAARIGGDEFVLLFGTLGVDLGQAIGRASNLVDDYRRVLNAPYHVGDDKYSISASFGIALMADETNSIDDYVRYADTAMYKAKGAGGNRFEFFVPSMQQEVEERLALEQDIRHALGLNQLSLNIQPQFNSLGCMTGAELLLRWRHPSRGQVSPAQFIPIAEETGNIREIGHWVLEQACATSIKLNQAGLRFPLAVNISMVQMSDPDFVINVKALFHKYALEPKSLNFEVTESIFAKDLESLRTKMHDLGKLGIGFSIDDFGTGYSSLSYLQQLPIAEIKIDRSFVANLPANLGSESIVNAIISIAKSLGFDIVAEGVETAEQATYLFGSMVDRVQGYYFSKPLELESFLAEFCASTSSLS